VPKPSTTRKLAEAKVLIESGVHAPSAILRACASARNAKSRMNLLQNAFYAAMKDPEFLAEMKKSKLEINPLTGSEVNGFVGKLFQMDATNVAKIKEVLIPKK
jgi:hypothetical protein